MAKWGEGDPRWIVEERADAKNVNNWHWTEKNASQWSKDKITQLLQNLIVENDDYLCEITDVKSIEGEAYANNRKAKLIFFYEWKIEGEWKGQYKKGENKTKYEGKFTIPNLSEENEPDELDFDVSTSSTTDAAYKVKEFVRKEVAVVARQKMAEYIAGLKTEYSKGLILPSKNGTEPEAPKPKPAEPSKAKSVLAQPVISSSGEKSSKVEKIDTKKLTMMDTFMCSPADLFEVFVEPRRMAAFSSSEVECKFEKGGRFALFGGTISGHYDTFERPSMLQFSWRHSSWPTDHYSKCTLKFELRDNCTQLTVLQAGVPARELDSTRAGWQQNYFNRIKQTFGFGSLF